MIIDSLRYWVEMMHVDGFRFDLASILTRDSSGNMMSNPPLLWDIESDPSLAGTKIIAEAWDAAGLYQVGTFVGDSWREWNGRFRDDVRSFVRGDEGYVRTFADRALGSIEIYGHKAREAEQSINFITCHDGFTLNDLVSYNQKHNEANNDDNRDGADDNRSGNYGIEGPTDDTEIEKLRNRQVKNFLITTLMSLGLPMITMGDEVRRTQHGNNNAYCHDDESTWLNWDLLKKHSDVYRFVQLVIHRRLMRDVAPEQQRMSLAQLLTVGLKGWHGVKLNQPDWNTSSHSIALSVQIPSENLFVYFIFNAYWESLDFEIPPLENGSENLWHRWVDTFLDSPQDIVAWDAAPVILSPTYRTGARSVVVLWAKLPNAVPKDTQV
jgi:glycogen operon protein